MKVILVKNSYFNEQLMKILFKIIKKLEHTKITISEERIEFLYIYNEIFHKINLLENNEYPTKIIQPIKNQILQMISNSQKIDEIQPQILFESKENQIVFSEFFYLLSFENEEIILKVLTEKYFQCLINILSHKDPVCVEIIFKIMGNLFRIENFKKMLNTSEFLEVILSHLLNQKYQFKFFNLSFLIF